MIDPTPFLRFCRNGALPRILRPVSAFFTGFVQILTTRDPTTEFLGLTDVTVPYGPRSALLGLGEFPLALDGAAHAAARCRIGKVIAATTGAHEAGLYAAGAMAEQRVAAAANGRLDVIGGLIDPALAKWIEVWFGLPGLGPTLLRTSRLVTHTTFLNREFPKGRVDAEGLRVAVDWVEGTRREVAAAVPLAPPGTVAAELLGEATLGSAEAAASHLFGLAVGPLALGSWAMALVVDAMLVQPWVLEALLTDDQARDAFQSALRRQAPLPGLPRHNPVVRDLTAGTQTIKVPVGPVLAATKTADLLNSSGPILAFGSGAHACMGPDHIADVAGRILHALGSGSPRRVKGAAGRCAPGQGPTGVKEWQFPGRMEVQLLD